MVLVDMRLYIHDNQLLHLCCDQKKTRVPYPRVRRNSVIKSLIAEACLLATVQAARIKKTMIISEENFRSWITASHVLIKQLMQPFIAINAVYLTLNIFSQQHY